ncbi:hypothetical protein PSHT_14040 [Puccinia striiformis]|uniref:Uncharacterized protein n=1 Tax=Puccinia striiformis TaxID=27350 RepID=A0A2S4UMB2_9BASI|nr:hypothetical protein PSHT_14040 [Puccinia striiformis]
MPDARRDENGDNDSDEAIESDIPGTSLGHLQLLNPTIARYRDTWNYSAAQHGLESWGTSDEHAPLFRSKIWGTAAKMKAMMTDD